MDNLAIRDQFDYIPALREHVWGLHVTGVGRLVEPPRSDSRPRELPGSGANSKGRIIRDYALVYLTEGHGRFKGHETSWRRVEAGDVLVLFPGIRHDYYPTPDQGWTEHWVTFNGGLANHWCMNDILSVKSSVLRIGVHDEIIEAFDRLREIAGSDTSYANQIQSGITMEILGRILKFQQLRTRGTSETEPAVESALEYIRNNWSSDIEFTALAKKMGIGYRHFRRLFQKSSGVAPHQYLLNLRLNHAKRLLRTLPVAEVADRVGFKDPLYFSRIFKKKIGVAPTHWR